MRSASVLALIALIGCNNDVTLGKSANVAPQVTINAPDDGTTASEVDALDFVGTVTDSDGLGDLQAVVWLSNLDGEIGVVDPDASGVVRLATTLSPGTHTVTLTATDSAGLEASDSVAVIIDPTLGVPRVDITNPPDFALYPLTSPPTPVAFAGGVTDPNQDAETLGVVWTIENTETGDGEALYVGPANIGGSTTAFWEVPELGSWRVTLEVTDDQGNKADDQIRIDIVDPADDDRDGDSWSVNEGDCDDDDPRVHPGADEVCEPDLIDEDCSGRAEDKDLDGDNHIDQDCVGYTGARAVDDCDDENSAVFPGAPEAEDGVDNDCDDLVDEGTDRWDDDGDCFCEGETDCLGSADPACVDLGLGDCDDSDPDLSPADADLDGFSTCEGDCDDTLPELTPVDGDGDGTSTCDGDCDDTDPDLSGRDDDADGYSTCGGDCDDDNPYLSPADLDGDGFST
ncbi:MAG: hypothetical protein ACI8PZ_007161, partial [Myxococcota bacterium]